MNKIKMAGGACKSVDGDAGTYHRGHGGARVRQVRARKRAIEKRVRQAGRRETQSIED